MNSYWVRTVDPVPYLEVYPAAVQVDQRDGFVTLDVIADQEPTLPGDLTVGGWDQTTREPVVPTDAWFYTVRPLGNESDGRMTGPLLAHDWDFGTGVRKLEPGRVYPEDNAPMGVEVRQRYVDHAPNHHWSGWYWIAEIPPGLVPADRSPSVRAVYQDADSDQGDAYTTGAFVLRESEWMVDEHGDPIQVWATEGPPGRGMPDPSYWKIWLMWASAREGYLEIEADNLDTVSGLSWKEDQVSGGTSRSTRQDDWSGNPYSIDPIDETITYRTNGGPEQTRDLGVFLALEVIEYDFRHHVWEQAQAAGLVYPEPLPANGWVQTSAVVTQLLGTIVRIDSVPVAESLAVGDTIRFGDGPETEFVQIWPGTGSGLRVNPYPTGVAVGDIMWIKL